MKLATIRRTLYQSIQFDASLKFIDSTEAEGVIEDRPLVVSVRKEMCGLGTTCQAAFFCLNVLISYDDYG